MVMSTPVDRFKAFLRKKVNLNSDITFIELTPEWFRFSISGEKTIVHSDKNKLALCQTIQFYTDGNPREDDPEDPDFSVHYFKFRNPKV